MTKIEKKLLAFFEKYLYLFLFLFVTLVAFLIRRQILWFRSEDYIAYYDFHEHTTQTAAWFAQFRWIGKLFEVPINGSKWLLAFCDFVVALEGCLICFTESKKRGIWEPKEASGTWLKKISLLPEVLTLKLVLLYSAFLLAPTVILRGFALGREDSFAMAFLLGGYLLFQRGIYLIRQRAKHIQGKFGDLIGAILSFAAAVLMAGFAVAACPWFGVIVIIWSMSYGAWEDELCCIRARSALAVLIGALFWGLIYGKLMDRPLYDCITGLVRFLRYDPVTGIQMLDAGPWMWQMLLLAAYPVTIMGGIRIFMDSLQRSEAAERSRRYKRAALFVSLVLVLAACLGVSAGISVNMPY